MKTVYNIIATVNLEQLEIKGISTLIQELNYCMGGFGFNETVVLQSTIQVGQMTTSRPMTSAEISAAKMIFLKNLAKNIPAISNIEIS